MALGRQTHAEPIEMTTRWDEFSKSPYYIPWSMRGLIMDEHILKDEVVAAELSKVLRSFTEWKPTAKALKDLKYRFDPIKTKL